MDTITPKKNSWSIVILGLWNRMIFNPSWVGKNVFESETVECLVSVMPQDPTIFRHGGISLLVQDQRLILRVDEYSLDKVLDAEKKALRIIQELPHTPLIGIGINFGFVIDGDGRSDILTVFNHDDDSQLTEAGWQVDKRVIERILKKEDESNYVLKFTMSLDKQISFDANFHHPINKYDDAISVLSGRTNTLLNELITMMSHVYDLDFTINEGQ